MKKREMLALLLAVVLVLSLAACGGSGSSTPPTESTAAPSTEASSSAAEAATEGGSAATSDKAVTKIGMLLPGVITDQSWCTAAYNGLMELKDQGYETAYTENMEVATAEAAFRNYAEEGYQLIIGHGSQFGDAGIRVAEEFPDTYFFIFGKPPSDDYTDNMGFVDFKGFEGAYLCGALAAKMSESGKIGYVGGIESAAQLSMRNAYIAGAESINDGIEILGVMAGTFDDPAKGKESALAQIEQGVDVIMHTADSTGLGVIEAAKENNVYVIGYGADQSELAPDLMLTSLVEFIPPVIVMQAELVNSGDFGGVYRPGLSDGGVDIVGHCGDVTQDIQDEIAAIKDTIISGETTVAESYDA